MYNALTTHKLYCKGGGYALCIYGVCRISDEVYKIVYMNYKKYMYYIDYIV